MITKDFTMVPDMSGNMHKINADGKQYTLICKYCDIKMLSAAPKHVCPKCGRLWALCSKENGGCGILFVRRSKAEKVCPKCAAVLDADYLKNRGKHLAKARRRDGLDFTAAELETVKAEKEAKSK